MRYINVTIIDSTGSPSTTQISTPRNETWGRAMAWMEDKMADHLRANNPLCACYMYDTGSRTLLRYIITGDGMRALNFTHRDEDRLRARQS